MTRVGVAIEARREAAPEAPADALQDALPPHVLAPLLRAVEAVAVAFDREAPALGAFDHEIDAEALARPTCGSTR